MSDLSQKVVIIGGGFGGLACARQLKNSSAEITLIDRRNFHLFQPLLYQVATGELSPANIASPLRGILSRQKNCRVVMGEVNEIDLSKNQVHAGHCVYPFDYLVVATGSRHSYFGHDEWEEHAPGLKSVEDATRIRQRILSAFERAEIETDPEEKTSLLTFVIVGAGPTGGELAGALSEIAHHLVKRDYRNIDPGQVQIILCEGSPHVLNMYPEELCNKAADKLKELHVTVKTGGMVTSIDPTQVTVSYDGNEETINTRTVIWAAGVQASRLGKMLADKTGAETNRTGKVIVNNDLSVGGHPNVFVIGDLAHFQHSEDGPLPALAPVAIQQGEYDAKLIGRRIRQVSGKEQSGFAYKDPGSMAVIGRYSAVALVGSKKRPMSGIMAWFAWLLIHLMQITQFRNRVLVFFQWAWTFFTRDRAARLITEMQAEELETTSDQKSSL